MRKRTRTDAATRGGAGQQETRPRRVSRRRERDAVARELHDGLAQELAYIASRAGQLDRTGVDGPLASQIQAAAQRALFEVRCAIERLRTPEDVPFQVLVERVTASFRLRFGVAVELDLDVGLELDAAQRTAVLRILGEALANAVSHGGATHVSVRLGRREEGLSLRVQDDGCGFDGAQAAAGWGLVGMRERAELLGGRLSVASDQGAGAVVEAVLP